ncbi:hypothetical protein XCR1_2410005 [Xenorhabdus cabanillasii JM26]|uniref:Uncharacterized protein n=1 Tax=Xenorhabdus cabanillasii JM26 TaxID=1427517 RepID=W1J6Z9_9GAMM|nr:hypothetical protein XCR1_2410005 [Xenorhabdus cabanillasii JM26]
MEITSGVITLSWGQENIAHYALSILGCKKTVLVWDIFRFPNGPLQQILGYANIQQTTAYAHLAPDYLQLAITLNPLSEGIEI